ncbi:TetR/AcrR family transcriptional regulator [Amycolatopsis saalfeldensis]|uniref:Regulatory protein, tetR family n=1 Tax=Amycolatopsis saalfeldensis TaxID=394193 RepID=A0A1H8XXG9_9PSEU|nr:TetR/AcrR family transcriptional regulator [Amycolatopsis saalfeldensis]SEP44740.1 regulatory protein, tetR family [Amycolatopsis saalfeldensis]
MAHMPAEQRKDEFVEAAVAVIAEHGVRGATTRRIAEAANAPLASLHYCFATKEDLFLEAFNRVGLSLVPEEDDPAAGVTAGSFLRSAIDWMLANRDYALAQVELYLWILRTAPAHAGMPYETIANALSPQLARTFPDIQEEALSDAVWLAVSAVDGLVLQWFYRRDDEELRRLAAAQAGVLDRFVEEQRTRQDSAS